MCAAARHLSRWAWGDCGWGSNSVFTCQEIKRGMRRSEGAWRTHLRSSLTSSTTDSDRSQMVRKSQSLREVQDGELCIYNYVSKELCN